MSKLDQQDREIVILGDLNCDLIADQIQHHTRQMINFAGVYQLSQLINEPTRITETSATLIDHIYTSHPDRIVSSGVVHCGISDHSLVYAIRKIAKTTNLRHKYIISRNFKNFDASAFTDDLKKLPWNDIHQFPCDPNVMWKRWKEMFLMVLKQHAPHKKRRIKHKKIPWFNAELKELTLAKDKSKKLAIKSGKSEDWKNFKQLRNKTNNNQVQSNVGNPRAI